MNTDTKYIIAYLEQQLPEDEHLLFEKQIEASEALQKEVNDIAFIWKTSSDLKLYNRIDVAKNWNVVSKKIHRDQLLKRFFYLGRNAAAILLLPILLLTGFLYFNSDGKISIQETEMYSAYGTITKTTLSDGTEVWLNSGSKLIYPKTFTEKVRTVYLFGEAYFKVSSDKSHRFDVVLADELVVSAYGTEFNINAYNVYDNIDITLVKGNIEVRSIDNSMSENVIPGQSVTYSKEAKEMTVRDANLAMNTGWIDGVMIFRRTNMVDVVQHLARHFNADIRLEDKELYDYEYSATFTTETLNEILFLLEKTAPIQYRTIEPEQSEDKSFSKRTIIISLKK